MRRLFPFFLFAFLSVNVLADLPFDTVFKGRAQFDRVVSVGDQVKTLPLGDRVATIGKFLCGTPYKSFTLEIDDHIESPSVNLNGLDCWTFFETALAFSRLIETPPEKWTPDALLDLIEADRYWGGTCDGTYLSRLHYLEDWLHDNAKRGLIRDLTRSLGGRGVQNSAIEMTNAWRGYRYMRSNPDLRVGIAKLESRLRDEPLYCIPKDRVPGIADLCCYWFEKAREQIERAKCNRAGLLATQGIRGGANREVLKRIKETGDIFFAVSDRDWLLDGATVSQLVVKPR